MFDDSLLPGPGERLIFGVHRQRSDEAETAPAWPPLAELGRLMDRRRKAK